MAAYHFPVLVWSDHAGGFTAAAVPDAVDASAVAGSVREALGQVEDYLRWQYAKTPWWPEPDFHDARLTRVRVEVRPGYRVGSAGGDGRPPRVRTFACQESVTLRVPCVVGRDSGGLLLCAMPTLGLRFTFYEESALRELVTHAVQSELQGMTPQQVARFLPPKSVLLERLVIRAPRDGAKAARDAAAADLKHVTAVAEPLGVRGVRRQLSRPWERDEQVNRLVEALGKQKSNVILLGEAGAGKTAALAEAVRKVERDKALAGNDDENNADAGAPAAAAAGHRHRFWLTSAARLIAGMQYLGQWQERCEAVIAELADVGGYLCVENLLELVRVGGVGPGDSLAAFLLPYVQRGEVRVVGEATPAELDACRRLLPGFTDLFQIVTLPPFTRAQAVSALTHLAGVQKQNLRVDYDPAAVEVLYRVFNRFMPYHGFPGRAASFLTQLFDRAYRAREARITPGHVIEQLVRDTGLPDALLRDEQPLERDAVLAELRRQVIGQPAACEAAADLVVTLKAGLNDPGRPVGVLLFCGPTGVGKTELAKAISRYLFGHGEHKDRLVRLDLSEYAGPGAAERLLGGAGGRGEPSAFIQRVRRQPFAVVLLDEIEKASPEVFDVLLNVFDEGRLTDPYGRLTTFRSTILVMTSNLGADRPGGFGLGPAADRPPAYADEAMSFFRPEFFNRIDAVVSFDALDPATTRRITEKELGEIAAREGLTRSNLKLRWTDRLTEFLIARGFDRRYGARPLQRAMDSLVVAPLARFLLDHPALRNAELRLDVDASGRVLIGGDGTGSGALTDSAG